MGLFGDDDEQNKRLDELERHMRRVVEQVGELSVDLSQTRMELLKARAELSDVDPVFDQLNASITAARAQLKQTRDAADESWAMLQSGSDEAVSAMRAGIDGAYDRLDEASGP
jgi:chromosome segregation ATPase